MPLIEMEPMVMGVPIRKIFLSVCLLVLSGSAFAQSADSLLNNFGNSILKKMPYPPELVNSCTPTFTILKITVNKSGEIANTQLSDSADPLFVIEWLSKKKFIDFSALKKYINRRSISSAEVLLPINYTFSNKACDTMNVEQNNCAKLFLFENKSAIGNFYVLPSLNLFLKVTVSY